ncbi:MAG: cytochrome c1 [Proteobacteria bacterium]|nr:cytochrome c1 [Pseudomonadota bacterium]
MRIALPLGLAFAAMVSTAALADDTNLPPKDVSFSFEGPFGHYDRAALQRGFQVYKEVCSACHSLNRVAFHTLDESGGPEFSEAEMKAIAAGYQIDADPNEQGDIFDAKGNRLKRAGTPSDYFPGPFANENAARAANNGALPPDLSLIVKERAGGAHYVYSILTGFGQKPPADVKMQTGMYYNPYFPGRQIAMPPPLTDNQVTFNDGTKATVDQEAHDVATFLSWTSEPKMEERKHLGFDVMIFLLALSGLLYLSYRRVWKDAH